MTIKRILHASDFSSASRPAFRLTRELARTFKAHLIVFHAYEPLPLVVGEAPIPPKLIQDAMAEARRSARREIERLARAARQAPIRVSTRLAEGPPARSIIRAAKSARANLIVVGSHGRSGLSRLLLGSVAERVIRTAPCPVLTVGPGR